MTAVNLLVQDSAAHLITDGAYYDAQGTIAELRTKVTVAPSLKMAIGCSGRAKTTHIAEGLGTVACQTEALARLPALVAYMRSANRRMTPDGESGGTNELMLFVALWSTDRSRGEGYVIASDRSYLGEGYTPGTLVEVVQLTSPPLPDVDLARFRADTDAAALLDAQRRYVWPDDPTCYVGGFGELTTVTALGVMQRRVRTWPDRVGERIAA